MKSAWEEAPQLKSPCSQLGLHIYVSSSKYAYVLGFLVKRLYKEHFEPPPMPFFATNHPGMCSERDAQ